MGEANEPKLEPSHDVALADSFRERLVGFGEGVYSVVPDGFPAYVRLFHPAYDRDKGTVRSAGHKSPSGRARRCMH